MENPMTFSQWLLACGQMAMIRHDLERAGYDDLRELLAAPNQYLEAGNLRKTVRSLEPVTEKLKPVPTIALSLQELISTIQPYDGVVQAMATAEDDKQWVAFDDARPEPMCRIRVKGHVRNKPSLTHAREAFVDNNRQYAAVSTIIDTHWQYADRSSSLE